MFARDWTARMILLCYFITQLPILNYSTIKMRVVYIIIYGMEVCDLWTFNDYCEDNIYEDFTISYAKHIIMRNDHTQDIMKKKKTR